MSESRRIDLESFWNMALGLSLIDEVQPSDFLMSLISQNLESRLSIVELEPMLKRFYGSRSFNKTQYETDLICVRIVVVLSSNYFVLSPNTYKKIHGYLFENIYDFAGKYRTYNITKSEPILNMHSVKYAPYHLIEEALYYDFKSESKKDYSIMTIPKLIDNISDFTSRIWHIHPFGERKYKNYCGFNSKIFKRFRF